jgi:hypothetical protein
MWKHVGIIPRRILFAALLASSLGTAAFAFNATLHAKSNGCCMIVASCNGDDCVDHDECSTGYCCSGGCD